jgi:hypothetical protein
MNSVEDDVWRNVFLFFLAQSFMQHGDSLSAAHYNLQAYCQLTTLAVVDFQHKSRGSPEQLGIILMHDTFKRQLPFSCA